MTEMVADDLLDADTLSRSINGFEQIAVRTMFREKIDDLARDATMFLRALLFVLEKRDGMADHDAFRKVMNLTLEDVTDRFKSQDAAEPEDEDAVAERDRQFADFIIGTRLSYTVEEFMNLTLGQRAALIEAANKRG